MNSALNPYESPTAVDEFTPEQLAAIRRKQLQLWLAVPALGFIILGFLQGFFALTFTAALVAQTTSSEETLFALLTLADGIFMFAVVWAGFRMHQLRSIVFVRGISLVCCIPGLTPFCLLGMPFAIWALVVLSQQRAEAFFLENDLPQRKSE